MVNLGALVPLDNLGHYFHWHWIFISFANLAVIGLMVVVFVTALLAPFPGRKSRRDGR